MERNENGMPITRGGGMRTEDMTPGQSQAPMNMGGCSRGGSNGNGGSNQNGGAGCGGSGNCLDGMPLAYAYVPDQRFRMMYSPEDALAHGTLFEELYKPPEVYGHE